MRQRKIEGLHLHRLTVEAGNPEERRFARAWQKANVNGHDPEGQFGILAYLLCKNDQHKPLLPTDEQHTVAATVIQWLGTPTGRMFLEDLGYVRPQDEGAHVAAQVQPEPSLRGRG